MDATPATTPEPRHHPSWSEIRDSYLADLDASSAAVELSIENALAAYGYRPRTPPAEVRDPQ